MLMPGCTVNMLTPEKELKKSNNGYLSANFIRNVRIKDIKFLCSRRNRTSNTKKKIKVRNSTYSRTRIL